MSASPGCHLASALRGVKGLGVILHWLAQHRLVLCRPFCALSCLWCSHLGQRLFQAGRASRFLTCKTECAHHLSTSSLCRAMHAVPATGEAMQARAAPAAGPPPQQYTLDHPCKCAVMHAAGLL